jgi:hypothetical protein
MQRSPDCLQDRFGLFEHRIIPESQNINAVLTQEFAAPLVARDIVQMLTAVQFNRTMARVVVEIQNVCWKGMLTTELESTQSPTAQQVPWALLRICGGVAQVAGEGKCSGRQRDFCFIGAFPSSGTACHLLPEGEGT